MAKSRKAGALALLLVFSLLHLCRVQAQEVPPLAEPVTDQAGLLSPGTRQSLNSSLAELWRSGGSQVAVLIVPSLEGVSIEQYSIKVVDDWKLGTEHGDNGVLFLIAKADRMLRIEVGQGLEGALTDAHAKRIIAETVSPLFRAGRFDDGALAGVQEILQRTDPEFQLASAAGPPMAAWTGSAGSRGAGIPGWIIILVFTFITISALGGLSRNSFRPYNGLPGGFRGGFGGGSGGGGFGGGGGGFSGGGASGGW